MGTKNISLLFGSLGFQLFIILFSKYSVFFYLLLEIMFSMVLFLNFSYYVSILIMVSFLILFVLTLFSLFLLLKCNLFLGEEISILLFWLMVFLKQGFGVMYMFFLKEKVILFNFLWYIYNSEFVLFWLVLFVLDCFDFKDFLVTSLMLSKGAIFILLAIWFLYLLLFVKFLLESEGVKFILAYFLFSQYVLIFSIGLGLKYFFLCLWVDLMVFLFFLLFILFYKGEIFNSLSIVIYLLGFLFLFSLPPYPSFYLEVGFFYLFFFMFASYFYVFILMSLFLFLFAYFSYLLEIFYEFSSKKKLNLFNLVLSNIFSFVGLSFVSFPLMMFFYFLG